MPTNTLPGSTLPGSRIKEWESLKTFGRCIAWLNNPFPTVFNAPRLSASVGERQPNLRGDVRTVQRLINTLIENKYLIVDAGVLVIPPRVPESGVWDRWTADTVKIVERRYFNGMAHPLGVVTPQGSFFRFLVEVIAGQRIYKMRLVPEMHELTARMVPKGTTRLPRSQERGSHVAGDEDMDRITTYLPSIIAALDSFDLADTNMVLMALATIQAESSGFMSIPEGISYDRPARPATREQPAMRAAQGNTTTLARIIHEFFGAIAQNAMSMRDEAVKTI